MTWNKIEETIDDWVLWVFQQFCNVSQRLLGTSAATYERLFLLVSVFYLATHELTRDPWGWKIIDSCLVVSRFVSFWQSYHSKERGAFRNSRRITERRQRFWYVAATLMFFPMDIAGRSTSFWFEAVAISMCFGALDDLPPSESRKWIKPPCRQVQAEAQT